MTSTPEQVIAKIREDVYGSMDKPLNSADRLRVMVDDPSLFCDYISEDAEWAIESLESLLSALEAAEAERDALRKAAEEVIDRWDTPSWKDVEPTAAVINRLRAIIRRSALQSAADTPAPQTHAVVSISELDDMVASAIEAAMETSPEFNHGWRSMPEKELIPEILDEIPIEYTEKDVAEAIYRYKVRRLTGDTPSQTNKLLPCPFCGGEAIRCGNNENNPRHWIMCRNCHACPGGDVPDQLAAETAWNTRAATADVDAAAAIILGAAVLTRIEDPAARETAIRNALTMAMQTPSPQPREAGISPLSPFKAKEE